MCIAGLVGIVWLKGTEFALDLVGLTAYHSVANYTFSVVVFFILMAQFVNFSGIGKNIYDAAYKWLGHIRGGLGISTTVACGGFGAICGSSMATAMTMGAIAYPEMKRLGYDRRLSTGCLAAGGTIGIMIPPSLGFVYYGMLTGTSIGKLFIAGIFPGLLQIVSYSILIYLWVRWKPSYAPLAAPAPWKLRVESLKPIWLVLLLFIVVIGGLYAGFFTATEAGAVGATGAFIVAAVKQRHNLRQAPKALLEGATMAAMVLAVVMGAMIFSRFLALTRLPSDTATLIAGLDLSRYAILAIIAAFYIILGMFLDNLAITFLTVPMVFPIILVLGFNPIWFGVIYVRMIEMSFITPPIGFNVFVLKGVLKDVPMVDMFKGIMPFLFVDVINLLILIAFPQISLWLPSMMMAR